MKKYILIATLLWANTVASAQEVFGTVDYDYVLDWIKIQNKASYLSKEEKDRMAQTWKNESLDTQKMKLFFDGGGSYYTYENQQATSEDGSYSWMRRDYFITRNFANNTTLEVHETLGRTYVVADSVKAPKWKVLNELKDIGGYMCMKATTYDAVKKQAVVAWFCADIPVSIGPENYLGLPGLILELSVDNDAVVITAKNIDLKKKPEMPKLSKKLKGKKINQDEFNALMIKYITESTYNHRFPYDIRY
jgi:GLPGLI family protein